MAEAYAAVPDTLKNLPCWVTWRLESDGNGRKTKLPYQLNGRLASSTDPATWHKFTELMHCEPTPEHGAGFVFSGNGIVGIDLDSAILPDGTVDAMFKDVVSTLASYTEVSPSGKGLHIFVRCSEQPYEKGRRKNYSSGKGIEVYSKERYFTVTGQKWNNSPTEIREYPADVVREVCNPLLNPDAPTSEVIKPPQQKQVKESTKLTDDEVIEKALKSKNGDKFRLMYEGAAIYPSESELDFALACALAFWTGNDATQIERIMRGSGASRPKWNENATYLPLTILNAISKTQTVYSPKKQQPKKREINTEEETELTEVAVSEKFVSYLDNNCLFNASTKQWHVWDGKAWHVDDRNIVLEKARRFVKSLYAGAETSNDIASFLRDAKKINSKTGVKNIVELAAIQLTRTSDDFDTDIHMLNVQNGTLVFDKGVVTFKEHDKTDMCSLICNVEYNPDANSPDLWLKHIKTVSGGDNELESNIQEIFGYILDGGNPYEHFLIIHGGGRNGKSVTTRTLLHILGDYGITVNPLTLMENGNKTTSPERMKLQHKRFIVAQEPNKQNADSHNKDTSCLDAGFIKAASGGDTIPARNLFSNVIKDIRVSGIITFSTNPLPKVTDDSLAFWERVITVPFKFIIPAWQRDSSIEEKLRNEASGILNWLIQGYIRSRKCRFKLCEAIRNDIAEYRNTVDEYAGFVNTMIEDTFDGEVRARELYDAYVEYQKKVGCQFASDTAFGIAMKKRFNWKRSANGMFYQSIKIKGVQTTVM